ncbi:MAG: hypothetical protein ACRCZJ_01465 [Erysipelotrichaceae bacterium]
MKQWNKCKVVKVCMMVCLVVAFVSGFLIRPESRDLAVLIAHKLSAVLLLVFVGIHCFLYRSK